MNIEVNVALRKNQPLEVKKMVERKRKRKNFDVFQKTMWFVSNRIMLQYLQMVIFLFFSLLFNPLIFVQHRCLVVGDNIELKLSVHMKKYIEKKDYIFYSVEIFF